MKLRIGKPLVIVLALVVAVILWAAFRPELLFVHTAPANDPFPTTTASAAGHV